MSLNKARVLLVLPEEILGRARVLAGKAMATLRLPVSLQIVLRALIEEGLKRDDKRAFLSNVAAQAQAVRRVRGLKRRAAGTRGRTQRSTIEKPGGTTQSGVALALVTTKP